MLVSSEYYCMDKSHQFTFPSGPYFSSSQSFAFLKCPFPKNPLCAEKGEGCCITSYQHVAIGTVQS